MEKEAERKEDLTTAVRTEMEQPELLKFASQVPGMLYQFEKLPNGRFRVPFSTNGITEIYGCTPEDVRDDFLPIARYIHPEDLNRVIDAINESASLLSPFLAEYRVLLPGQPAHWVMARSTPEMLANGSILFHGFNTDITDWKKLEESNQERIKELTCLNEVSALVDRTDISNEQIWGEISTCLRKALTYPELAAVRIEINGRHYQAGMDEAVSGNQLACNIMVKGQKRGRIEIFNPPGIEFNLPYEQHLIENTAGILSQWLQRKAAEESLAKEKELFQTTLFSITDGIIVTDISGKIMLMNPMAEYYTGWVKEEAYRKDFELVFHNINMTTKKKGSSPIKNTLERGSAMECPPNAGLVSKYGVERYISGKTSGVYSQNGELTGVVVAFRDVTKEYSLEKEIEGFLNVNLDMLCVSDRGGNLHKINKKFEDILGYSSEEIEGKRFISFVHEEDVSYTLSVLAGLQGNQTLANLVNRYRCRDGTFKYVEWNILQGAGDFMYISARDVTEKRMYEEELKRLAIKDELTGLYNRNYFEAVILESMEHADRYNESLSMLLLDLDYFKKVNDTWGHPIGDELLKQTAQTIGKTVRDSDTLVRFGGEEFVVLMPQTSREGATAAAEKIRAAVDKDKHPVTGLQTVSIGVAQRMKAESFRHWYRRLDEALYRAKEEGRNRVAVSDESERLPVASVSLSWRNEWASGNKEIDAQHKEMIEIANRLINMSYEGMQHLEILGQLERLLSHILSHFAYEVKLLARIGYTDHLHHEEGHKTLVTKALWLKESYESGGINASAFFSFVVDDVILGHLVEEDTKFFQYIGNEI